jgi:hypothetical protein
VRHVAGEVADVRAEADHRRLVAHGADAVERRLDGGGVAYVAAVHVDAGRRVRRAAGVEHADVATGGRERIDDVRAHEPAAARDQDDGHAPSVGADRAPGDPARLLFRAS